MHDAAWRALMDHSKHKGMLGKGGQVAAMNHKEAPMAKVGSPPKKKGKKKGKTDMGALRAFGRY